MPTTPSKQFERLSKRATPGPWQKLGDEQITAQAEISPGGYSCSWETGARCMTIEIDPQNYSHCASEEQCERWAKADRAFILWCANHRDLILEALKIKEAVDETLTVHCLECESTGLIVDGEYTGPRGCPKCGTVLLEDELTTDLIGLHGIKVSSRAKVLEKTDDPFM